MNNKSFVELSKREKMSKLARAIKQRTNLADDDIISAVSKIKNLNRQYKMCTVSSKDELINTASSSEEIINPDSNWPVQVITSGRVLVATDTGGIAEVEKKTIGSLDLSSNEKSYYLFIY